ncbi:hypothetical protein N9578_00015 [bacterium]|jgi:hypothetical protein|nr:hypothetical protein [bacterium]MDB4128426.1 hypothetical protein [bacterium]
MARKKFNPEELQETDGPMNDVAKADAMVYAKADPNRPMDNKRKRIVVAKKQQIKNSTNKANRRNSKNIIRNLDK